MKQMIFTGLLAASAAMLGSTALADDLPYQEGPVLDVSSIKIKQGHFAEYWKFLETDWKAENEEAKKQGIILSYAVYGATARTPNDPDLYLVIEYPNMAAFDGLDAKMTAIIKKLSGSTAAADKAQGDRDAIRTVLGEEIIRELKFK